MTHTEALSSLASERYLLDEMTEQERDAFEAHYFECAECADDVTTGARMQDGIRAGLLPAPQVARVATFTPAQKPTQGLMGDQSATGAPWYRALTQSTALPWAVAATLAIAVGFQAQRGPAGSGGSGQAAVETLSPTLLRPASRGAAPSLSLKTTHVALALDVDASGATLVAYELRDAAGAPVTSGQNAAPVAGAPLLLVIPSFTLKPEQRYILTVRDAANPTRMLGEYPFATTP